MIRSEALALYVTSLPQVYLMSGLACFRYDICKLKAKVMDCIDTGVKLEEGLRAQDESQKTEKLKEMHLLLKKKLSLSHELIKQYNDKVKECQERTMELAAVRSDIQKITQNHNFSLTKVTQLELENNAYREKFENFEKITSEQQTKIAADKQHLQQLICKVKELEHKETGNSKRDEACKEKLKTLEEKLREVKKSYEAKIKAMEIKAADVVLNETKIEPKVTHEKSTHTGSELQPVPVLPEMANKCTMTNEFYSIKDDPYPLFCSKCLVKLDPSPLDQILKVMSCPALVTEVRSPTKKSSQAIGNTHVILEAPRKTEMPHPESIASSSLEILKRDSDVSKSDFQRLEYKISSLERKIRKKLKKQKVNRTPGCCSCQHPNNCGFGLSSSFLQSGPAMKKLSDLLRFRSWQEGSKSRKRSSSAVNREENCSSQRKFRKKRKLENSTSKWNVDSILSKDLTNSGRGNTWGSDSEAVEDTLRAESSLAEFEQPINRASKRRKVSESCSLSRRMKRDRQLVDLFSPAQSPASRMRDPGTNTSTDEEILSEPRVPSPEINCAISKTISEEEATENGNGTFERSFENQTVECPSRKRYRSGDKPIRKSTKSSLASKIRNLKTNCNKVKPLPSSALPGRDKIYGEKDVLKKPKNNLNTSPHTQGNQTLNAVSDYCPIKKQRIAHSARKPEIESLRHTSKNSVEILKVVETQEPISTEDGRVNANEINDPTIQPAAIVKKVNNLVEKNKSIECRGNSNPAGRLKHSSNSKNAIDEKISQPVNNTALKNVDIEPLGIVTNQDPIANTSEMNKTLAACFQPCVMIPKLSLGNEGVTDILQPAQVMKINGTGEDDTVATLNSNSANDASLRILRSHTKVTEVMNATYGGTIDSPMTPMNELSEPAIDVPEDLGSTKFNQCQESIGEVLENEAKPVVASVKHKRKAKFETSSIDAIRELRSRRIMLNPSNTWSGKISPKQEIKEENLSSGEQISAQVKARSGFGLKALIEEHIIEMGDSKKRNTAKRKTFDKKLQERRENLVTKELSKLAKDETWTTAALEDAIRALSKFKAHTVAKCVVNFLFIKAGTNEALDRTHTPPAPLLSKTQQRILALMVVLKRTTPEIIKLLLVGIEFQLFRLSHAPEVAEIVELARFFTVLCRIEKDRERVRIFCCDAIYCLGLKAMCLIYVILISWPEVLPKAGSSSDPLLLCMIELIMTQQGDQKFPMFFALKKQLSHYYQYEPEGRGGNTLINKFLQTLKEERQNGLDTAIILFAKKKEPIWVYENIIKRGLLHMIIQKSHPSVYDAFCLLGHLMRAFPTEDKKAMVNNIFEQLRALIESGEGSMEHQEGVATALLSLTRHKLLDVAKVIVNWEPKEPLSETMSQEITTFFNIHPPKWWRAFIRKNCEQSFVPKRNDSSLRSTS